MFSPTEVGPYSAWSSFAQPDFLSHWTLENDLNIEKLLILYPTEQKVWSKADKTDFHLCNRLTENL
jgi:hypothetical protein